MAAPQVTIPCWLARTPYAPGASPGPPPLVTSSAPTSMHAHPAWSLCQPDCGSWFLFCVLCGCRANTRASALLSHPRPHTLPASQSAHTSASLAFFRDPTAHSHAALSALPSQPSPPSACTPVCRSLPKHDLLALSARVLSPPLPVSSTRCPAPSSLTETHTSSVSTGFTRVQVKQYLLSCQLTASTSVSSPPHSHLASSPHPPCLPIPSSPPPSASSFVILPSLPTLVRHAVLSTLSLTLASHLRASTLSSLSSTMSPVPSLPHCRLPALSRALCSHHPGLPLPPPKSPFSTSGVCSHIHFVLSQLRMSLCLTLIRWCADTLCVINPLLQYTTSSCLLPGSYIKGSIHTHTLNARPIPSHPIPTPFSKSVLGPPFFSTLSHFQASVQWRATAAGGIFFFNLISKKTPTIFPPTKYQLLDNRHAGCRASSPP